MSFCQKVMIEMWLEWASLLLLKVIKIIFAHCVGHRVIIAWCLSYVPFWHTKLATIYSWHRLYHFYLFQMKTPAIQNDFSYYRRIVSRQRIDNTSQMLVTTELANRMSLFYAHATPMLKVLSEATSKFVHDNADDVENTTETLGTMAKVCLRMLENP